MTETSGEERSAHLVQRTPTTAESTYPFPRSLFGLPYGLPDRMERMWRSGGALEPLRAMLDAEHLRVEEVIEDDALVIRGGAPGGGP